MINKLSLLIILASSVSLLSMNSDEQSISNTMWHSHSTESYPTSETPGLESSGIIVNYQLQELTQDESLANRKKRKSDAIVPYYVAKLPTKQDLLRPFPVIAGQYSPAPAPLVAVRLKKRVSRVNSTDMAAINPSKEIVSTTKRFYTIDEKSE